MYFTLRYSAAVLIVCVTSAGPLQGASPKPLAEYAKRLKQMSNSRSPSRWIFLSRFCEKNLLFRQREEALHQALELSPNHERAHRQLGHVKVRKEWLTIDEAEVREAREKHAKGQEFYGKRWWSASHVDKLRAEDSKKLGWPVKYRVNTLHAVVYSSESLNVTRKVADLLENAIVAYMKFYRNTWKLEHQRSPFKMWLFAKRDTYARAIAQSARILVRPGVVGLYVQRRRALFATSDIPSLTEFTLFNVVVHEMVHGLDFQMARKFNRKEIPMWIIEGRAEHFGYSIVHRQVIPGALFLEKKNNRPYVLKKCIDELDLRDVLERQREDFQTRDVQINYAVSWAFVHFLFHGEGGKYARHFKLFLSGLPRTSSMHHFEKLVGKLSKLEPQFKKHVKEYILPRTIGNDPEPPQEVPDEVKVLLDEESDSP